VRLFARRLARLAATRSPHTALEAVRREARLRRADSALGRAARRGEQIVAGPFLGEVGYELLYWIPFLRRILREHGVARERVTVVTRGGAAAWYADFAGGAVEILDLVEPAEFASLLVERRARERHAKQFDTDAFDLELVRHALARVGSAHVLHPLVMFTRFRFIWEGLLPPERATELGDYRLLDPPPAALALPEDFVAVKAYFSESLPDNAGSRSNLGELFRRVGSHARIVTLANATRLDEHDEWNPAGAMSAAPWLEPRTNLAVQTEIVSRARALVCTYGGFAYLGAMLGIPTLAVYEDEAFNPVHLDVARAAFPGATLNVVHALDAVRSAEELLAA
jgi:hypothetical protein